MKDRTGDIQKNERAASMRRFLYFLPGVPGANKQMLQDRGLLNRFTTHGGTLIEHAVTQVLSGPDGGGGCIVAAGGYPPVCEPGKQLWMQGEKFWAGVETLAPGPDDLIRDIVMAGYEIVLGDNNLWRVPLIRRWDVDQGGHVSALPKSVRNVVGADGSNMGALAINPNYVHLDKIADRVWLNFIENRTVPMGEALAICAALLGVGYRLGAEEIGLLGLVDEELMVKLAGLCLDAPVIEAQVAKRSYEGLQASDIVIEDEESPSVSGT